MLTARGPHDQAPPSGLVRAITTTATGIAPIAVSKNMELLTVAPRGQRLMSRPFTPPRVAQKNAGHAVVPFWPFSRLSNFRP